MPPTRASRISSGTNTSPLARRRRSDHPDGLGRGGSALATAPLPGSGRACTRLVHPPEPAVAFLVVRHGLVEMAAAEIRPQRVRDPHLGVGELPEHEVGDAHLTAGADE